jgi:HEAT repeat protein
MTQLEAQSDDAVRGHIAVGLGLMNATESIEQIQEIVADSKYRAALLQQAAIALGLLGDRGVAGNLAVMLREEAKSLASQAAIASALGFIGDSGSIDPLLEMMHDDKNLTDRARAFAIAALGIVGDKEPLPWNSKLSVDLNYRANASTLVEGGKGVIEIL